MVANNHTNSKRNLTLIFPSLAFYLTLIITGASPICETYNRVFSCIIVFSELHITVNARFTRLNHHLLTINMYDINTMFTINP